MIHEALAQAVGRLLWRGSFSERLAVGVFARLRGSALLTEAERAPLPRFLDEEVTHGNLLRSGAMYYCPARPALALSPFDFARLAEPEALAVIAFAERFETPGFGLGQRFFAGLGDRFMVAAFGVLLRDEPGHIAWSRRVLRRLRQQPALAADFARIQRDLAAHYQQLRRERAWLREPILTSDPYDNGDWGGAPHALSEQPTTPSPPIGSADCSENDSNSRPRPGTVANVKASPMD